MINSKGVTPFQLCSTAVQSQIFKKKSVFLFFDQYNLYFRSNIYLERVGSKGSFEELSWLLDVLADDPSKAPKTIIYVRYLNMSYCFYVILVAIENLALGTSNQYIH
jgi:hypothetical protein